MLQQYILLALLMAAGAVAGVGHTAHASGQYDCAKQYGDQCPNQEFSLKKFVKDPKTKDFVDTIESSGNKFSPGSTVSFKIRVSNTGNQDLKNLQLQDTFPDFVSFISGPGTFDSNTKILKFGIESLNAGETKEIIIEGKIASEDKLPGNESVICLVNQISLEKDRRIAIDNAQFCIQKRVLGETKGGLKVFPPPEVATTPPTGPNMILLFSFLSSGILGITFRRLTTRKT